MHRPLVAVLEPRRVGGRAVAVVVVVGLQVPGRFQIPGIEGLPLPGIEVGPHPRRLLPAQTARKRCLQLGKETKVII